MKRKVLFVCWGNICRSVMAEYICKQMRPEIDCESRAVSNDATGCDIYPAAKRCLDRHGIAYQKHRARRVSQADYEAFDEIYVMDELNMRYIKRIIDDHDRKILMLCDDEIEDPWYTDRFDLVYDQILEGIRSL
ncbi:MAG: low molecular weight phosphotyrosine protein phosphatase [Erysipelotrichaceae bacterium]|nr:low molecular weight phosphotyrosine protein phosphatase [Erysipelotrichaceae bacterium]